MAAQSHDLQLDALPSGPGWPEYERLRARLRQLLDEQEQARTSRARPPDRSDQGDLSKAAAKLLSQHQLRARFVHPEVALEPAWPMVLELLVSFLADKPVTTKQLTLASTAPATTALRWINHLVHLGYAERHHSAEDRRLALLRLSAKGVTELQGYFRYLSTHGLD